MLSPSLHPPSFVCIFFHPLILSLLGVLSLLCFPWFMRSCCACARCRVLSSETGVYRVRWVRRDVRRKAVRNCAGTFRTVLLLLDVGGVVIGIVDEVVEVVGSALLLLNFDVLAEPGEAFEDACGIVLVCDSGWQGA